MAATAIDVGFGSSITYQSGLYAKITGISGFGFNREAVDTSHFSSTNGWGTSIPSRLRRVNEMTVDLLFDKNAATKTAITTQAPETITTTFPIHTGGSAAASIACSGYITNWEGEAPMEEAMSATATNAFTGEPTWSDGS